MQVIAGHDPEDPGSAKVPIPDYPAALTGDVKGLVIGVPESWLEEASRHQLRWLHSRQHWTCSAALAVRCDR